MTTRAIRHKPPEKTTEPRNGHGRNGAGAYRGAEQIDVPHSSLETGGVCPESERGKVYEVSIPGVLVRIVGSSAACSRFQSAVKLNACT